MKTIGEALEEALNEIKQKMEQKKGENNDGQSIVS